MLLPGIPKIDPEVLKQEELAFKFMRLFVEILRNKMIANRPVSFLSENFARIEIANVTRDNCLKKAAETIAMVSTHNAGNNVFEFSRIAVAAPEQKDGQYTICFYGHWKTEELENGTKNGQSALVEA